MKESLKKKMIMRAAAEEIVARADQAKNTLHFILHCKGGVHAAVGMERPRSAAGTAATLEALEIIRRLAVR